MDYVRPSPKSAGLRARESSVHTEILPHSSGAPHEHVGLSTSTLT